MSVLQEGDHLVVGEVCDFPFLLHGLIFDRIST